MPLPAGRALKFLLYMDPLRSINKFEKSTTPRGLQPDLIFRWVRGQLFFQYTLREALWISQVPFAWRIDFRTDGKFTGRVPARIVIGR